MFDRLNSTSFAFKGRVSFHLDSALLALLGRVSPLAQIYVFCSICNASDLTLILPLDQRGREIDFDLQRHHLGSSIG